MYTRWTCIWTPYLRALIHTYINTGHSLSHHLQQTEWNFLITRRAILSTTRTRSVCLSVYLSIYLPVCLSIFYLSVYLSVCLPTCLSGSVCLSACLPVCLSVCLPVCLSLYIVVAFHYIVECSLRSLAALYRDFYANVCTYRWMYKFTNTQINTYRHILTLHVHYVYMHVYIRMHMHI